MNKNTTFLSCLLVFLFCITNINASSNIHLNKANIDLNDRQSLQRGAKIFFDQCQGCHSIKYMRYLDLAEGIKLLPTKDKSIDKIIRETLMHSTANINENSPILTSMYKENATKWFGKTPPDLSLISRYRGSDWLYTYMKSFYKDTSRPWNVNNLIFPDVGMPHVLLKLQGTQILKDNIGAHTNNPEDMLELIENGDLSKEEYNNLVSDLVAFLSYVGEPIQLERHSLGIKVIIFLIILMISLFLLKREFWKDLK